MKTCPKCKGRATKLYNISTGIYTCQQCEHKWKNEERKIKGDNKLNIEVYFHCYDCEQANKQNRGDDGYELKNVDTQSLSTAINDHVNLCHEVVVRAKEESKEDI